MTINSASDFLKQIKKHPENFYLIHYSCQSLYDDNEGLSPRITSIAITHYSTGQTVSFSTHSVAEELGISRTEVRERFDEVERQLLHLYYDFVRDRRDKYWVHWNMRNLTYGFEHLEHRFRVLGGENAPVIPVERRLNLNDLLSNRYGTDYTTHPKMLSLMELNGGRHRHLLSGPEEVEAFANDEFIRMHNSTLSKVGFLATVIRRLLSGRLKTTASGFGVTLDRLFESRIAKAIGFLGAVFSLLVFAWQFVPPLFTWGAS